MVSAKNEKQAARSGKFLSPAEREEIMAAIAAAETATSGEIRVHIESRTGGDTLMRAAHTFDRLGMHRTAQRNGVLIYIAVRDREFAIIGDQGINAAVPEGFWQETRDVMATFFARGEYAKGICQGLKMAGDALGRYFPFQGGRDVNELSDEISEGE